MKIVFSILFTFLIFTINAQVKHVCGNSVEDQLAAEELARLSEPSRYPATQRNAKIYIPVTFHVVTNGDGSGGVRIRDIYKQLCKLNADYAEWEMIFYPKNGSNFPIIKRGDAYSDPRTYENVLNARKDNSSLNIFVVGEIGASGVGEGTVLGYYSPSNDIIVCQKKELADASNTLSHEVGHFFSLRHTFFGWECDPYEPSKHGNPVTRTQAPCAPVPVEVVARTNCSTAADELCDTPPDYNFGITTLGNNCNFTLDLKDRNGDRILPMKENQMSYFSSCNEYKFTQNQYDRMLSNYNLGSRDYIKSAFIPNESPISPAPTITVPVGSTRPPYNGVEIQWTPSQNAEDYLVEMETATDYRIYITKDTFIYITDLEANKSYFTRITPVSKGYYCAESSSNKTIRTATTTTSTFDQNIYESVNVHPNPASEQVNITIASEVSEDVWIQVYDVSGRLVQRQKTIITSGINHINIDLSVCESGVHILSLTTPRGEIKEKLNVVR